MKSLFHYLFLLINNIIFILSSINFNLIYSVLAILIDKYLSIF